jgi:hypothetical protein
VIDQRTFIEGMDIYFLLAKKGLIVSIEISKTPSKYIVFASSTLPQHDDLVGMARQRNRNKCARLAFKDLYKLIEE